MMVQSPKKSFQPEELFLAAALQTRAVPPFLGTVRTFLIIMFAVSVRAADPDSLSDWLERMRPMVPRGYLCPKATGSVTIDGKLDDAAWAAAPWTEEFVDIEGDAKPKPRFRSRAKMLWDDENFYVAAEMEEPHVWGTLTKHDSVIFHDPAFEVFIDPDGDSHEYYEFEMNALNTGWDLFLPKPYKDGGKADDGWEIPGLKTAVHVRGTLNGPADKDDGWSVEIAFPWRVLAVRANRPAPPREGDQWQVGFSRVEWEIQIANGKYEKVPKVPENNWVWSAQGVVDMHRPERWGCVQFAKNATAKFVPDESMPARDALHDVYYAQRAFRKKNGIWAKSLEELKITVPTTDRLAPMAFTQTDDGWTASVALKTPGAEPRQWNIRQDARVWSGR
jgi:hypothetical protein